MSKLTICDLTLRDGNHAKNHQLSLNDIHLYSTLIEEAGVDVLEVGHGNGLGASSLQFGLAAHSDEDIITTAKKALTNTKLSIHIIPGLGLVERNLKMAIDRGVNIFRVASHCTEANLTQRHIEYLSEAGCEAYGVLMMSHMSDKYILLEQAIKMQGYGAKAILLMDSAGHYLPQDVKEKITYLIEHLRIPVGFHAHNNLGLAVANSLTAIEAGATIIDGTAGGFGAGAGNAPIEIIVSILIRLKYNLPINLSQLFKAVETAKEQFAYPIPTGTIPNIVSGLHGVFSGFAKPIQKAAKEFDIDPCEIYRVLGEKKIIAGQEDFIIEIAQQLQATK